MFSLTLAKLCKYTAHKICTADLEEKGKLTVRHLKFCPEGIKRLGTHTYSTVALIYVYSYLPYYCMYVLNLWLANEAAE